LFNILFCSPLGSKKSTPDLYGFSYLDEVEDLLGICLDEEGSNYSDKELKQWLGKIQDWRKKSKTVFVYFNNDAYGFAIKNALALKKLVSQD
jgi:uncharacterized protein YecE (DUF72 family)